MGTTKKKLMTSLKQLIEVETCDLVLLDTLLHLKRRRHKGFSPDQDGFVYSVYSCSSHVLPSLLGTPTSKKWKQVAHCHTQDPPHTCLPHSCFSPSFFHRNTSTRRVHLQGEGTTPLRLVVRRAQLRHLLQGLRRFRLREAPRCPGTRAAPAGADPAGRGAGSVPVRRPREVSPPLRSGSCCPGSWHGRRGLVRRSQQA